MILHHVIDGDGPPLVLSPSLGSTAAMWEPQVALADRFRVIRHDPRGHGSSPVPDGPYEIADLGRDLLATLDHLGIERANICGLSLGGMTAMWIAANAPERVDRLVLCATSARMDPAAWRERARQVRSGGTGSIAGSVVERWLTPAYAAAHPDEVAHLEAMVASIPDAGYLACCGAIERMDLRGDLAAITAPTLVIAAAQDPATPPEHQERIAAGIAGARLEVLDPAAHVVSWERADDVTRLIREHLEVQ